EAECERREAELDLDAVLARGSDDARLAALREQGAFLRAKSADWRALHARAAARLGKRIITVVEFTNVQHFIDALERKLVQVEGDASQLEARALRSSRPALAPPSAGSAPAPAPPAPPLSGAPPASAPPPPAPPGAAPAGAALARATAPSTPLGVPTATLPSLA